MMGNGSEYKVLRAGMENEEVYAIIEPSNPDLETEIKRLVKLHRAIPVYWKCGFCELISD